MSDVAHMALSVQDRIASLQSGSWSALCVGGIAVFCEWGNLAIMTSHPRHIAGIPSSPEQFWGSILLAAISGFLFGVTYRYIRREDPNPHLQTGAIAAFGLTRGLAQLDMGLLLRGQIGWMLLMAGESMLMIAIAAMSLDWAMKRDWIQKAQ